VRNPPQEISSPSADREALVGEEALEPPVDLAVVGGRDCNLLGADPAQPVDYRLAHRADRQPGRGAQVVEQAAVHGGALVEGERGADHHDGVDVLFGEVLGRRHDRRHRRVVALRRERAHADAARHEGDVGVHDRSLGRDLVLGEGHDEADGGVGHGEQPS
jgi:hypothetical protein